MSSNMSTYTKFFFASAAAAVAADVAIIFHFLYWTFGVVIMFRILFVWIFHTVISIEICN